MNVEMELTARIGAVAGKLHTGRSRNDQVATDLRLYLRRRIGDIEAALDRARAGAGEPGLTPIATRSCPATPTCSRPSRCSSPTTCWPTSRCSSATGVGSPTHCDARRSLRWAREPWPVPASSSTARPRPRSSASRGVTRNSIDAVGDRDPVVETISAAALTMAHLSRLAEEIVWWTNPNFGFVRPADAWSTGSSMMPNKRNPDPAELIRGRTARVSGHLVTALTMLKGIPGGYQRDLQEDKPPLVDALSTLESSLEVMAGMVATLHVDEARMLAAATAGYTTATAVADALVELGVPFREGHHIVGSLVARAEAAGVELTELSDRDIAAGAGRIRRPGGPAPGLGSGDRRRAADGRHARERPGATGRHRRHGAGARARGARRPPSLASVPARALAPRARRRSVSRLVRGARARP